MDIKLQDAARQFESLVARQLVREMQPEEGDAVFGLAQDRLADAIAASGGLGFARMLEQALNQEKVKSVVSPNCGPTAPSRSRLGNVSEPRPQGSGGAG